MAVVVQSSKDEPRKLERLQEPEKAVLIAAVAAEVGALTVGTIGTHYLCAKWPRTELDTPPWSTVWKWLQETNHMASGCRPDRHIQDIR
ncbi:hypothetical protein MIZ03_3346 [Rhodoferax lithotrophicus]|uniref:Uncharacterized protein n=1 Tax=Rhodoferax lithotrophicus TaxID=2798804 RepID=A0ABM7MQ28_9BURK|nr:hypothetical protein MIZ03_3346 [Rhodoferax sp. MIZ03]